MIHYSVHPNLSDKVFGDLSVEFNQIVIVIGKTGKMTCSEIRDVFLENVQDLRSKVGSTSDELETATLHENIANSLTNLLTRGLKDNILIEQTVE